MCALVNLLLFASYHPVLGHVQGHSLLGLALMWSSLCAVAMFLCESLAIPAWPGGGL